MNPPLANIMLLVDVLHRIAAESPQSYRAMLSLPPFARSLDPGIIADYKIHFGHSIEVTRYDIRWSYHGKTHRLDGPAFENTNGTKFWYQHGILHHITGYTDEHTNTWYRVKITSME